VTSARVNGKPKIVSQIYLGTIDKIKASIQNSDNIPDSLFNLSYDFGAVIALLDVAERIGIREIIEKHCTKRAQGLSVSDSMLLAAINRATAPTSKRSFHQWFEQTALSQTFPKANSKTLSSQGFWNNMKNLDSNKIKVIEDEITKKVVETYNIDTNCLLFDNTNFITYINTENTAKIPQRGNSKEKRTDLKIVGLSLMVSPQHNIPLFHEVYPGNDNDAKQFFNVVNSLKNRCANIDHGKGEVTLVFDKGNNSEENIKLVASDNICKFHFVGSLKLNQCPEFKMLPESEFSKLEENIFGKTTVYRTKKNVFGTDVTVVLTNNPELFEAQLRGILLNIDKCKKSLKDINSNLLLRESGQITKGKKPTVESIEKKVKQILAKEHMRALFDYKILCDNNDKKIKLTFNLNDEKFLKLKKEILGKTVLFTDQHSWSNEKIVGAYRAQYHVEASFRQMKNTHFLSFRPMRHFTDHNIKVHAFYCVLALTLCGLLNIEIEEMGHKLSIDKTLQIFQKTQQIVSVYLKNGKHIKKSGFIRLEGICKDYIDKYNLKKYCLDMPSELNR
jgi:transposase